ncbi:MAG: phosphoglycerate kinase [Gemmatimonadetes bacterium]|nr:MAG: phosphoglycerate kinase [Gemmatimonadota bacterium]
MREAAEACLGVEVAFCPETVGPEADARRGALGPGGVLLLENTRFHPQETANDPEWARALAGGARVFVNDAFGAAHRAHASTVGVADAVRRAGGRAAAGYLMERELRFLGEALADPARPFVAVLGGAKISGKIDVVEALLPRVDRLLIGGAMANTFLLALGLDVGASLVEADRVPLAAELMERAGERLLIPVDARVAERIEARAPVRTVARDAVPADGRIADIGPETAALYAAEVEAAGTVLWNGPMGVFEVEGFDEGTRAVAEAAARAAQRGATVVVGGGDSAAAAEAAGVAERLTHVSTGGGASLEFLAGRPLPGVEALSEA